MTQGEVWHDDLGENIMTKVDVIDLGPNNIGSFGPSAETPPEACVAVAVQAGNEKYTRPTDNSWGCVDGRLTAEQQAMVELNQSPEVVSGQIAGSISVTNTASDFMNPDNTSKHSELLAANTQAAVAAGDRVFVHGDNHKGKAGCKANADTRAALRFNAENADIVIGKTWGLVQAFGLDRWVSQDDLSRSVLAGKDAAANDSLWDVTPEEAIDVMVANGAEYQELQNSHEEQAVVVHVEDDNGFSKVDYARDHSTSERQAQAFAATMKKYVNTCFNYAKIAGESEQAAALKAARGLLFNVGITKTLINENMKTGVVSNA